MEKVLEDIIDVEVLEVRVEETKNLPAFGHNPNHKKKPGSLATNPFVPTETDFERVLLCAKHGMSKKQIRSMIKDGNGDTIGYDCFKKYFDAVFAAGLGDSLEKVGSALLKTALQSKTGMHTVKAAELFLKCKGLWVETDKVEIAGKDGGPIEIRTEHDISDRVAELLTQIKSEKANRATEELGVDKDSSGDATSS